MTVSPARPPRHRTSTGPGTHDLCLPLGLARPLRGHSRPGLHSLSLLGLDQDESSICAWNELGSSTGRTHGPSANSQLTGTPSPHGLPTPQLDHLGSTHPGLEVRVPASLQEGHRPSPLVPHCHTAQQSWAFQEMQPWPEETEFGA